MQEIWKDIIIEKNGILYDFTGLYQVSNFGRIRNLNYRKNGKIRILKPKKQPSGHLRVNLPKDGKLINFYVHRIVATVFIPNLNNLPVVNHKDENKENNCVENLEWCTVEYNNQYSAYQKKGKNYKKPRKTICVETEKVFNSVQESAEFYGISQRSIRACAAHKQKTAGGYHWMYYDEYLKLNENSDSKAEDVA